MPLKDTINADLKTAMLARDELTTTTLRGLKATILNEEVATHSRDSGLTDEMIEQLIAREVKKRDEAAGLFRQGGNDVSADKELTEKAILMQYLPQQLSEEEIAELVDAAMAEIKPEGAKDIGRVIGAVKAQAGNAADGSKIAQLVKDKLS